MEGQVEMFVEGWLYYILYGYVNRPGDLPAKLCLLERLLGFSWKQIKDTQMVQMLVCGTIKYRR